MSDIKPERNKSRGGVRIELLFRSDEIGVSVPEPHTMRAIQAFLDVASSDLGRAIAPRLTQMPRGVLLLQTVANEPASGAIYIFDRDSGNFYAVLFDGAREELTVSEYEQLVREYGLLEYAVRPSLIQEMAAQAPQA